MLDAREYHVTVLDMVKYDADFAKCAKTQVRGKTFHFKSTGMDMFNEFVVVRLDCPEWTELVKAWIKEAESKDLEPHTFPGDPKAHISVGKSEKWPQGIPNPHVKFDTRKFNINKNSMAVDPDWHKQWTEANPYLYHGRQDNPDAVRMHGIEGSFANYYPTPSVYMTNPPDLAEHFALHPGVEPEWEEDNHPGSYVYQIDTRKLDPKLLEPDEWHVSD